MDVFKFLKDTSSQDNFYLSALNLRFDDVKRDMSVFEKLVAEIGDDDRIYTALLKDRNWRSQLIAYVCLVLSENKNHFVSLSEAFSQRSWVSPQLAVALFRLHRVESYNLFETYFDNYQFEYGGSDVAAVLTLAPRLRMSDIKLPICSLVFDEFTIGMKVTKEHSEFWHNWLER
jgi:hypothetical protein